MRNQEADRGIGYNCQVKYRYLKYYESCSGQVSGISDFD
jgi:hypothetical protein